MTVLVLVGGRGSRLGAPKHLIRLCGRALLEWVLGSIPPSLGDIYVVSPEPIELRGGLGWIRDPGMGPAEALRTAARELGGRALVVGGDMPLLDPEALELVYGIPSEAAVPMWSNGFLEPLHAAYELEAVAETVSNSLHGIVRELDAALVSAEYLVERFGPHIFYNVNTREDLEGAERILRSRRSRGCS